MIHHIHIVFLYYCMRSICNKLNFLIGTNHYNQLHLLHSSKLMSTLDKKLQNNLNPSIHSRFHNNIPYTFRCKQYRCPPEYPVPVQLNL